jgi:hypothetical protein
MLEAFTGSDGANFFFRDGENRINEIRTYLKYPAPPQAGEYITPSNRKGARCAPLGLNSMRTDYTPTARLLRTGTGVSQSRRSAFSPRTTA